MAFKVEDEQQRIFSLTFFPTSQRDNETRLEWKISDTSRPGIAMVISQGNDVQVEDWSKLSDDEARQKMDEIGAQSYKQLLVLSSFLELVSDYPKVLPNELRNKPEVLGMCLEDDDPARIYDFFYASLNDTTTSAEDGETPN